MSPSFEEADRLIMAALSANVDRPQLLPHDEDVLDGYVLGLERAAILLGRALGYENHARDLIGKGRRQ